MSSRHEVDLDLPAAAFESAGSGNDAGSIAERYLEPITALQDGDLQFPEAVKHA